MRKRDWEKSKIWRETIVFIKRLMYKGEKKEKEITKALSTKDLGEDLEKH